MGKFRRKSARPAVLAAVGIDDIDAVLFYQSHQAPDRLGIVTAADAHDFSGNAGLNRPGKYPASGLTGNHHVVPQLPDLAALQDDALLLSPPS